MYKVKSHTVKRRIYDIDSNKKLLRKNIWNYIENQIFQLSYIKNIKSVDNHIKHNTKKDFEKKLMDSQIKKLYEKHYNIKVEYILERIDMNKDQQTKKDKKENILNYDYLSKQEKKNVLIGLLNRTFQDFFIEYRNSELFWKEAKEDCESDNKKLLNYIKMSRKFINYVNNQEKANLTKIDDDTDLSEDFLKNYASILSKNPMDEESNMNVNNTSNFYTEEINRNKTTLTVTQQINTIMSLTESNERLNTYLHIFKGLDSNEQSRLFKNINNFMNDVNEIKDENNNINFNSSNLDNFPKSDNLTFNMNSVLYWNIDQNDQNQSYNCFNSNE